MSNRILVFYGSYRVGFIVPISLSPYRAKLF